MCTPKVAGESVSSSVTTQSNSVSTAESSENASSRSSNIKTSSGNVTCKVSYGDGGIVISPNLLGPCMLKQLCFVMMVLNLHSYPKLELKKLKARMLGKTSVELSTLNVTETVETHMYEVVLITTSCKKVAITAIGLPRLTGPVSLLDETAIAETAPYFDVKMLQELRELGICVQG